MHKILVISVLMAYQVVNDSSLTIVTDKNIFTALKACLRAKSLQLCPTLCNTGDAGLIPG